MGGGGGEELGMSADISGYFLWIVGFLGRVFKSVFFLGDENVFEKNWAGIDSFPFTDLLSLNILRQFLGPSHRFAHLFLKGLNVG